MSRGVLHPSTDVSQQIPVIFEGDFWAEEAVRLARAVDRKDDGAEDSQSPLELCRCALPFKRVGIMVVVHKTI